MPQNRNAPTREGEGVECLLAGDIDVTNMTKLRTLVLARAGITINRAALLSSLAYGEVHAHG